MTRSIQGIWRTSVRVACALVIVGSFTALTTLGCESGGVGDPCIPEDEFKENFPGFSLIEEYIESRSFQCKTRICLVNHFQGRASCPRGQDTPQICQNDGECGSGESCVRGGVVLSDCDPTPWGDNGADENNCNEDNGTNVVCGGAVCNATGRFCQCEPGQCPEGYVCQSGADGSNLCETSICHPDANGDGEVSSDERDDDERCYIPGTNDPIAVPVCGWCEDRQPEQAVYCSCRCGPPESGETEADENFNFCECPDGFVCEEVRKNVGLGDAQVAGQYCVRQGTTFRDASSNCGEVAGHYGSQCEGLPSSGD